MTPGRTYTANCLLGALWLAATRRVTGVRVRLVEGGWPHVVVRLRGGEWWHFRQRGPSKAAHGPLACVWFEGRFERVPDRFLRR